MGVSCGILAAQGRPDAGVDHHVSGDGDGFRRCLRHDCIARSPQDRYSTRRGMGRDCCFPIRFSMECQKL